MNVAERFGCIDAIRPVRRPLWVPLTLSLALALFFPSSAQAVSLETPFFEKAVASGALPPVSARIPSAPSLAELETIGRPGGELRMLMSSPKDTRMMVVYGYARLVRYTPALALVPDMLEAVDVSEGRSFTLHLRPGHKWSDGQPFTAEDFRYWFEDMANNPDLSQMGLPTALLPNGEAPHFEVLNETTVRYSWSRPNPLFLPALAGADPLYIFRPAHYLKKVHAKYADKEALKTHNPDLPTLEPWVLKTRPPADRLVFERNPYYYRIDGAGHQLPYLDQFVLSIADSKIIAAKTGAGESDLQARYLRFDDYTFLKAGEEENNYKVRLWRTGRGSQFALYPNLNVNDPVWRSLFRDVRFRRALSLAVNRHEINQAIYFGLAIEGQNTILPQSPLYQPEYRDAWSKFDIKEADRLLDLIGLTQRDSEGTRLLPDGRPLEIIVENSGESTDKADVLELIRDSWRRVGVKLFSKPSQLTLFRRRVFSGDALMSIDWGIENGLATAEMSPWEFAPTTQQQLEWPKWGQYMETGGKAGEPPDLPKASKLRELYSAWPDATTHADQARIWQDMLKIWCDEVYTIGLVAGVLQPVVVSDKLRNVPDEANYNWDPGAHFGIYKPDGFWLDTQKAPASSAALTR